MGASNVLAAYALYAGRVPPLSMQLLLYMAAVSLDSDRHPWFGLGHEALAEHALGRPVPITAADKKAVERGMTPLHKAKAIKVDRRASGMRRDLRTSRYRLNLSLNAPRIPGGEESNVPRNPGGVNGHRPPESVAIAPRIPSHRPPDSVPSPPGIRGTEEYEENEERENQGTNGDLRTDVTGTRVREASPEDPNLITSAKPWCGGVNGCSPSTRTVWSREDGRSHPCPECRALATAA